MTRAASPAARLLKCWGDEAVVYDGASGDTHYLKPLTLALYHICREHPGLTAAAAASALAARLGVADTPQLRETIEETLAGLRAAGLLEAA